jgi:kanamycin kinase
MILRPVTLELSEYPAELRSFLSGAKLYDSSCSEQAKTVFIDKDGGYFLKSAPKGALKREEVMTRYFPTAKGCPPRRWHMFPEQEELND